MTPGQRWRLRRNMVIAAAHRVGFSQRFLADVFDLPHSSIPGIIRGIEARADEIEEELRKPERRTPRRWEEMRADRLSKIARRPAQKVR